MSGCNNRVNLFNLIAAANGGSNTRINVRGNQPIYVTREVIADTEDYLVEFLEHKPLIADLRIQSITSTPSTVGTVPLRGVTVSEVILFWSFIQNGNAVDVIQTLNNISQPKLNKSAQLNVNLTHSSSLAERTWTIVGDDELGQPGSIASDSAVLQFGDRIFVGEAVPNDDPLLMANVVQSLASEIKVTPSVNTTPASLDPQVKLIVGIPEDKGTLVFRDLKSPIETDPMKEYGILSINNGVINLNYRIYVSKNGSLRNANIVSI